MKFFDTHCHLDLIKALPEDFKDSESFEKVRKFMIPGVDGEIKNPELFSDNTRYLKAWGIHPRCVDEDSIDKISSFSPLYTVACVGECGLDKYAKAPLELQLAVFERQIELAADLKRPVSVHILGFYRESLELIKKHSASVSFAMHSWSASGELAKEFARAGVYFSFSSLSLRNKKKLAASFENIPSDRILLETDAPDQSPGKDSPEELFYLQTLSSELSRILKISQGELVNLAFDNACRFFGVSL